MHYWIPFLLIVLIILLVTSFLKSRISQKKKLAEIKKQWGKPKNTHRNFKLIAAYLTESKNSKISANTAIDLDLDDLFAYIDRTNSKPGQQYLYKKLHSPEISEEYFDLLEQRITHINQYQSLRELAELELSALNNTNAYYLSGLFTKPHKPLFNSLAKIYIIIAPVLTISLLVSLFIAPNQFAFILLLIIIIANVGIHFVNKVKMLSFTHSLPQLLILCKVGKWLSNHNLLQNEAVINQSLSNVGKLKESLGFINFQNKLNSDPTDISYLISEWLKMFLVIEPLVFIFSITRINKYLGDIEKVYEAVAQVDMAISIQSVRDGTPHYCKPQFLTGNENILITDMYHPLIENAVANSINIYNKQGALITGSNMSGKTTFIRTIAINALLSQTINTSFASAYSAPPVKILTSISINDDLGESKSYFQTEALSVKNIIESVISNKPTNSLVIIDEIFRGTNTIERIAAAKAVLSYLIENKSFVFVSTHDLELAELLSLDYKIFSFEELIGDDRLVFDYKIKEGLLKNKNGIAILKGLGYPNSIIDDANRISMQLRDKYNL